jgi:hypothetical protein
VIVRLVLWNLSDSNTPLDELRRHVRAESVDALAEVPGLRLTAWLSDEGTDRFGAIYVWESREAAEQPLPGRVRELIGKDPELEDFDVEATIEGRFTAEELSRRGPAPEG